MTATKKDKSQMSFLFEGNQPLDALRCNLLGTSLIEASAGTGKTYAITTLYIRLLLERKLSVGEILVVTYTRAATSELRDRIRSRLQQVLRALEDGGHEKDSDIDTLVKERMRRGEHEEDKGRIRSAVRSFDQASIFTIHSFCQRVLQDSAFESGAEFETEFLNDQRELVVEVVHDFWANQMYSASPGLVRLLTASKSAMTPDTLLALALRATPNPKMPILPEEDDAVIEQALESWQEAQSRASDIWNADDDAIVALLEDNSALKKNMYRPGNVSGPWRASMNQTLRSGNVGIPADFGHFSKFTTQGIAAGTKRNCSAPAHEFFDACDALLEASVLAERAKLAMYQRLVGYARSEVVSRKRSLAVQSFDDLLHRLAAALGAEGSGKLAKTIRTRFPGALIDEFQDTDPLQYSVFKAVYGGAGDPASLFLIGDPKQAIYAFRGADVFAYMDARKDAGENRHSLGTNWRSDPSLVRAVNAVFEDTHSTFVFDEIEFEGVKAKPEAKDRMQSMSDPAALQIVFVERTERTASKGRITKGWGERHVPGITADAITQLLNSSASILDSNDVSHRVSPGDIAVLVRKNQQALDVQQALRGMGVPSVVEGNASVFETSEAEEVERILSAVVEPSNSAALIAALTTQTLGVGGDQVSRLRADEAQWDRWLLKVRQWHKVWVDYGFIQSFRRMLDEEDVAKRLLMHSGGERSLTNLYHLGELLQSQAAASKLGPLGLLQWMHRMRTNAAARTEGVGDSGLMRLESDADAVKLVTIHKSKGLEYPIVYCPYLWDGKLLAASEKNAVRFHDPIDHELKLDIGSEDLAEHRSLAEREAMAENLRLLYVALTRAKHMCTVIWGSFTSSETSPLGYVWHQEAGTDGSVEGLERSADYLCERSDNDLLADLEALRSKAGGAISVACWQQGSEANHYVQPEKKEAQLRARRAARTIISSGRFSSFSALSSAARSEGEERDIDGVVDTASAESTGTDDDVLIRLAHFPKGARVGVMFHEVLENTDFSDSSGASLSEATEQAFARYALSEDPTNCFLPAVQEALTAPLHTLRVPAQPRLCDLQKNQRLDELEFLFPVHEGNAGLRAFEIARVLEQHTQPPWPTSYPGEVARLDFAPLSGFLRGFVDLVFCFEGRWYLADYKSNFLGPHARNYAPETLPEVMASHHYFLQYLIYTVALHRFLKMRIANYDYDKDMGGVYYLFLRGMGPDYGEGNGVFGDVPPSQLIEALSELFTGSAV